MQQPPSVPPPTPQLDAALLKRLGEVASGAEVVLLLVRCAQLADGRAVPLDTDGVLLHPSAVDAFVRLADQLCGRLSAAGTMSNQTTRGRLSRHVAELALSVDDAVVATLGDSPARAALAQLPSTAMRALLACCIDAPLTASDVLPALAAVLWHHARAVPAPAPVDTPASPLCTSRVPLDPQHVSEITALLCDQLDRGAAAPAFNSCTTELLLDTLHALLAAALRDGVQHMRRGWLQDIDRSLGEWERRTKFLSPAARARARLAHAQLAQFTSNESEREKHLRRFRVAMRVLFTLGSLIGSVVSAGVNTLGGQLELPGGGELLELGEMIAEAASDRAAERQQARDAAAAATHAASNDAVTVGARASDLACRLADAACASVDALSGKLTGDSMEAVLCARDLMAADEACDLALRASAADPVACRLVRDAQTAVRRLMLALYLRAKHVATRDRARNIVRHWLLMHFVFGDAHKMDAAIAAHLESDAKRRGRLAKYMASTAASMARLGAAAHHSLLPAFLREALSSDAVPTVLRATENSLEDVRGEVESWLREQLDRLRESANIPPAPAADEPAPPAPAPPPAPVLDAIARFQRRGVPEVEPYWVQRDELLDGIVASLRAARRASDDSVVSVSTTSGVGGVGKTTLAVLTAHDARVQAVFPDGVLWLHVGHEPSVRVGDLADRACRLLGCSDEVVKRCAGVEPDLLKLLADSLHGKCLLFVLDDVWPATSGQAARILRCLDAECGARVMTTTRSAAPLDLVGTGAAEHAPAVRVDSMSADEAAELLRRVGGIPDSVASAAHSLLVEIAELCHRTALLLASAGAFAARLARQAEQDDADEPDVLLDDGSDDDDAYAAARGGDSEESLCEAWLAALKRARALLASADLASLPAALRIGDSSAAGVSVSELVLRLARELPAPLLDAFERTVVFDTGEIVPQSGLGLLWRGLCSDGGVQLARQLRAAGLLQLVSRGSRSHAQVEGAEAMYRLHDLVFDALRAQHDEAARARLSAAFARDMVLGTELLMPCDEVKRDRLAFDSSARGDRLDAACDAIDSGDIAVRHSSALRRNGPLAFLHRQLLRHAMRGGVAGIVHLYVCDAACLTGFMHWAPSAGRALVELDACADWASARDSKCSKDGVTLVSRLLHAAFVSLNEPGGSRFVAFEVHARVGATSSIALERLRLSALAFMSAEARRSDAEPVASASLAVEALELSRPGLLPADAGAQLWQLQHSSQVHSLDVSWQHDLAVCGCVEGTASVWRVSDGSLLHVLAGHNQSVKCVVISGDGLRIVTGSPGRTARVWRIVDGACEHVLAGHTDEVHCVSISSDGSRVVTGSNDKTARVWRIVDGACEHVLAGHTASVRCVCISSDGSRVVTGSRDETARVWRIVDGACEHVLAGHTDEVHCVSISSDGSRIVTGSSDSTARVWRIVDGACEHVLAGHTASVRCVCISSDGSRVVTGSDDRTARVWRIVDGACEHVLAGHSRWVKCVSISSDGSRVVTGSDDATARVWRIADGACEHVLGGHKLAVQCVSISSDGSRVVTGSWDHTARVWRMVDRTRENVLAGYTVVWCVSISSDGSRVVTGSNDKTARVWRIVDGACEHVLAGHTSVVQWVCISSDGSRVVTGSSDSTARVWRIGDGACEHVLSGHTSQLQCVSISSDGLRVVTGSEDHSARVWRIADGACEHVLRGHTSRVRCVSISSDGSRVVTGSGDQTARVWRIADGACEHVLSGHAAWVQCVSISSDGSRVVTGSGDRTARVWRVVDGACEHVLAGHTNPYAPTLTNEVRCVSISGDGSRIVTSTFRSTCVWCHGSLVKQVSWGDNVVQCEFRSEDTIFLRFAHSWPLTWSWREASTCSPSPLPTSVRDMVSDGPLASPSRLHGRQVAVLHGNDFLARGGFEAGCLRRAIIGAVFDETQRSEPHVADLPAALSLGSAVGLPCEARLFPASAGWAERFWQLGVLQRLPHSARQRHGHGVDGWLFSLHPLVVREHAGAGQPLSAWQMLVLADHIHDTVGNDGPAALQLVESLLPQVRGCGSGWSIDDCFVASPTTAAADISSAAAARSVLVASLESLPLAAESTIASACAAHFSHVLVVRSPVGCDLDVWRPLFARAARNRARLVRAVVEADLLRHRGAGFAPRDAAPLAWVAVAAPLCAALSQFDAREFDAARVVARCGDAPRDVARAENDWIQPRASSVASCSLCGLTFSVIVRKHHCRSCGDLLCSHCCPKPTTRGGLRMCLVCLL